MLICYIPHQVLEQLNVFAEDDVSAAAEALNDVRSSPEMLRELMNCSSNTLSDASPGHCIFNLGIMFNGG